MRASVPWLPILLLLAGCGRDGGAAGAGPVASPPALVPVEAVDLLDRGRAPVQVLVSARQRDEAAALGIPPAFQGPGVGYFVYVPRGTFLMGSPEDEADRDASEVRHKVHIDRGFYMQTHPEHPGATFSLPQAARSRAEALRIAATFSAADPLHDYRLPTEAEWEHAARAGTQSRWWWGARVPDDLTPYETNPWGLKGMGWWPEWCADRYGPLPSWEVSDPPGAEHGEAFVVKGAPPGGRAVVPARVAARHAAGEDARAWARLVAPVGYGLGRYGSVQVHFHLVDEDGKDAPNQAYDLRIIAMNDRLAARVKGEDAVWVRVPKPDLPLTLSMVPGSYYVYAEGRRDGELVRGTEQKFHAQGAEIDQPVPVPAADLSRFGSGARSGPK